MADDKKLDYITNKLDDVSDKVNDMDTKLQVHIVKFDAALQESAEDRGNLARNTDILQENTDNLAEHMKRTELLEAYIKILEQRFTPVEMEAARKRAVEEWIKNKLVLIAKISGAITGLGALAATIKMLLNYLA